MFSAQHDPQIQSELGELVILGFIIGLFSSSFPFFFHQYSPPPTTTLHTYSEITVKVKHLTWTARQSVLSMISTNMMYSNPVEFTTYQNLYWYGFLGMYLLSGRAFRAYSTH